jgi:hypothetical protein
MAATDDSSFWLADFLNSSPLKPFGQMNRNLVGSIYEQSSLKFAHFVPISFNSLGKSYLSFNREEDFLEINQSETRIACGSHVC